jgi:hypothetical protein
VRRSQFGHQEVAATHRDGDKQEKNIFELVSTECKAPTNGKTPRLRARGGIWEERSAKTKVRVKVKVKVKAKVVRSLHPPRIDPPINLPLPSGRRGSVGMRGKNVARSENV